MPFRDQRTKLTRQQLYDRIWVTPATALAKEFGISDVGLAKTCKRHKVPRPPRGYWAQLAFGKRPKKAPLPKVTDADLDEIIIFRQQFDEELPLKDKRPEKPTLVVTDTLTAPHSLVASTRKVLDHAKPGENGIVYPANKSCLNVSVTKAAIDRALRILDAFIKYWESIGGSVIIGQKEKTECLQTIAQLNGETVPFSIREVVNRTSHGPDPKRPWNQLYSYEATGRLVIEVEWYGEGLRKRWADGSKQRLEDVLGSFVYGVQQILEEIRLLAIDRVCEQRQADHLKGIRESAERRKKEEAQRREALLRDVSAWKQATEIREYLTEVLTRIQAGEVATNQPQFSDWIDWAWWYADSCDPLIKSSPRPEHVVQPVNTPVTELELTRRTRAIISKLGISDTRALFNVTKKDFMETAGQYPYGPWSEVCELLEIQRYDVSDRRTGSYY